MKKAKQTSQEEKDYSKAIAQAEELGKNSTEKDIRRIGKKLFFKCKGPVKKVWDKVEFMWALIQKSGVPPEGVIKIVGALIYLILPADVVPDIIPFAGFLDDVAVITVVYNEIQKIAGEVYKKYEKEAFSAIDARLQKSFYQMITNTIITFVITLIYILIKAFHLFHQYSNLIALIILMGNFAWLLARIIIYIYKYGKYILPAAKKVHEKRNLKEGILEYARSENNIIDTACKALNIANKIAPKIPDPQEAADLFIKHYKKRVILSVVFISAISIAMTVSRIIFSII